MTRQREICATEDASIPPGWDYNPAAFSQRCPIVALGPWRQLGLEGVLGKAFGDTRGSSLMAAQLTVAALGIWLMMAPAVLDYVGTAAAVGRIVGPIVATFAAVAVAECTRELRRANLPSASS